MNQFRQIFECKGRLIQGVIWLLLLTAACQGVEKPPGTGMVATTAAATLSSTGAAGESNAEQAVGGTLVMALDSEPATLDPHKTTDGRLFGFTGATLVTQDPHGGYAPYLAESWTTSPDGLIWDFKLRPGITFYDGTPLDAATYAWTFQRWLDPQTASPTAPAAIASVEAVGNLTLRLVLHEPYYSLLDKLSAGFAEPLSPEAVERAGNAYGRNPLGVGPYILQEWISGEKIVLKRNPDFKWAPSFAGNPGPAYIETIEIRIMPEYATVVAALEVGEVDFYYLIQPQDIEHLEEAGVIIQRSLAAGMEPFIAMNLSRPVFQDIRVRQALNLAVDRESLIKVAAPGTAVPQYGPLSPTVSGYWPGVEQIGYSYDLQRARELMAAAGWSLNSDGLLEKDGRPFEMTLNFIPWNGHDVVAQVLQQQLGELGIDVALAQQEFGSFIATGSAGDYDLALSFYLAPEFDVVYRFFHSNNLGAANISQLADPRLDAILDRTRRETDAARRQAAADEAQRYIVEQAYVVPLFTREIAQAWNKHVQDVIFVPPGGFWLFDAALAGEDR